MLDDGFKEGWRNGEVMGRAACFSERVTDGREGVAVVVVAAYISEQR